MAGRPHQRRLFAVVLVAILFAHSTVECQESDDSSGPAPVPQSEDSPQGGPWSKAMDTKHGEAASQKKEYDEAGGVPGIEHGGKLVKRWLKKADAKYAQKTSSESEQPKKGSDAIESEAAESDADDKDSDESSEGKTATKGGAAAEAEAKEESEKTKEEEMEAKAEEKVKVMEDEVKKVKEEAKKETDKAHIEVEKAKEDEEKADPVSKGAAKAAEKIQSEAYTAAQHVKEVNKQGQIEAKIQVAKAETIIKDAKAKAAAIIDDAKKRAAEIGKSARGEANTVATAAAEKVNEKAHALLAKAKSVEQQAEEDGSKARQAALKAMKAKKESQQRASDAEAQLEKANVVKTFARAKAAEQNEIAQKKAITGARYKTEAQTMVQDLKVAKGALKQEIQKEQARSTAEKTMALKLKETEKEARLDRQRAHTMVEKAEKAKTQIQVAAKDAIRKAVRNAAILASVQKKKVDAAASNERASKDIGSANTLAARAQTSAEERIAKDDIRKAKEEMKKVDEAKEKAMQKVRDVAQKETGNAKQMESLKAANKEEKNQVKADETKISSLKHELKEANTGGAGETLLSGMYQAIPYETACGSLAEDPAKIRTVDASNKGACAAKCAELSHCQSFQFQGKSCVLSKKEILKGSKYGEMLACASKNVLIKPDMKVSSDPSVYQKKKRKEELELLQLGESAEYGFETAEEALQAKKAKAKMNVESELTRTKVKAKHAAEQAAADRVSRDKQSGSNNAQASAPADQEQLVNDASAKKWSVKLMKARAEAQSCQVSNRKLTDELEALKLNPANGTDTEADSKCQAELEDYKKKFGDKEQEEQEKIQKAVTDAKQTAESEKEEAISKKTAQLKEEETAEVAKQVKNATANEKKVAETKLAKGKKDEAVAKEALKKAMTLTDAEKQEMKQNKKLADELGKMKTKAIIADKEKSAFKGELAEAKVVDKARIQKQKNKVEALEQQEIQDSASKAEAEEGEGDAKAVQKHLIEAARHLAIGLNLKKNQIEGLKAKIRQHNRKHAKSAKTIKKLIKDKKKANVKFNNCQRDKADKLRKARHKYRTSVDKLKTEISSHLTQSELAKRALQLCEGRERGSGARATARVARRENRAVRRAKRKMGEKQAEKNESKVLKVKLEAKIAAKLKKKFAKDVAKKVGKLTKKKMSPKCKACVKLSEAEQKMLAADCKACA